MWVKIIGLNFLLLATPLFAAGWASWCGKTVANYVAQTGLAAAAKNKIGEALLPENVRSALNLLVERSRNGEAGALNQMGLFIQAVSDRTVGLQGTALTALLSLPNGVVKGQDGVREALREKILFDLQQPAFADLANYPLYNEIKDRPKAVQLFLVETLDSAEITDIRVAWMQAAVNQVQPEVKARLEGCIERNTNLRRRL